MKKITLILAIVALSITLFSCESNSNSESLKNKTSKIETSKAENIEAKKETNIYVKDTYEKYLKLNAKKNKFSKKDWEQISKVCKAFKTLKNTNNINKMTESDWDTFFKKQGYTDFSTGKKDVLRFKNLYKVSVGLPTEIGSLNGIKKLYGEEQYEKSTMETGVFYNELNLSFEDLKNIEKYSETIGTAYLISMNF